MSYTTIYRYDRWLAEGQVTLIFSAGRSAWAENFATLLASDADIPLEEAALKPVAVAFAAQVGAWPDVWALQPAPGENSECVIWSGYAEQ